MTRRKQANPRSLKDQEENHAAKVAKEPCYTMVPSDEELNEQDSDQDLDYDDYAPLVVDTSRQTEDIDDQDDLITSNNIQESPSEASSYTSQTVLAGSATTLLKNTEDGTNFKPTGFVFTSPSLNNQDQLSNCSSEQDQLFIDSGEPNPVSNQSSRTPSISSLSDQLSPGGLSSNISASKVHRRGKKTPSNQAEKEPDVNVECEESDSKILPITNAEGEDAKYACPICKTIVASSHELTVHIRSHNTHNNSSQANTCTICGKVLSSQSSLDRHMLVHSGERPFKCKICKMSFTTNGNMHRHSRIHAKENDLSGSSGIKPIRPKPKTPTWKSRAMIPNTSTPATSLVIPPGTSLLSAELLNNMPKLSILEAKPVTQVLTPSEPVSAGQKRVYNFIEYSPQLSSPAKKISVAPVSSNQVVIEKKPTLVTQASVPTSITKKPKDSRTEIKTFTNSAHHDRKGPSESGNGEEKEGDQLHCPVCNKGFLCKYGLETHLDTHPEYSMKCGICHMSFPTPRGLNMHKLMVHSKEKPLEDTENKLEVKTSPPAVVGFYDLGFMDFSVKKFPLVAKSYCEENVRLSSSIYHNYHCSECAKAFPSRASLLLHEYTHSPEKTSQCPLCECDFLDTNELHLHMVKHLSDKAFNDVMQKTKSEKVLKSPKPDKIGKHDFLASFGLTTVSEAELLHKREKELKLESNSSMDKKENNDYFARLGQVFSSDIAPVNPLIAAKFAQLSPEEQAKAYIEAQKFVQAAMVMPQIFQGMEQMSGLSASQLKAFMPSLFPLGVSKSNSAVSLSQLTTLAAMTSPSMLSTMMGGQNLSSPLPTPPPSSESGSSGEMSDKYPNKNGVFQCKYCDLVFTNYRTMKGHTRTHLGLSPYKCNLCNYSSADKSTLIRHLRTHNGERPFQCRICDFAFTTKANCERHVKKKHDKYMKEEVDSAIGYNKYVAESSSTAENFQSPDTVCKYCGEDFKFFRALKHHLRSHSSCPQKPFLCMRCDIGFSTKANCVRHLQKQHPEVSQYQIEQFIHVNEPSLLEDGEKSFGEGLSDDSQMADTMDSCGGIPPAAHSSTKSLLATESRTQSPVTGGKPEAMTIKQEPMDTEDLPLDFSVNKSSTSMPDIKPKVDELPIDLSVKGRDGSESPSPNSRSVVYDTNVYQCQFCPLGISSQKMLERHLLQDHRHLLERMEQQALKDVTSPELPASKLSASQGSENRVKILMRLPKTVNNARSLKDRITKPDSKLNHGLDSASDLASVKRILDAAIQPFRSFPIDSCNLSGKSGEDSMDYSMDEEGKSKELEEPPVLSPRNKGDNSSMQSDQDMPEIAESPEQFAKMFINTPKIPKTVMEPADKLLVKKKRNSYADSPHKLQCPYCTRTFPWVSSLTRHLLTHTGQKPFKCPRCPVTFSTKSNRERHLIRKHGVNMMDPLSRQTMDRPYKCHLCVFSSFSTQGNLLKHYKERHVGCDLPDTLADLDRAVTKGLSTTIPPHERGMYSIESYNLDNQLNCQDEQSCLKVSDTPTAITTFIVPDDLKSDDDDDDDDDIIPLNIDNSIEESPPKPTPVVEFTGSGERQINPERDNYNVDKITSCWKCSEKFVSRKLLVRHLKEHNIDLPFKCYLCDASYETRKSCLDHQESTHSSDWKILKEKNKVDNVDKFAKHMDKVVENNCNKVDQGAVLEIPGQNADDPKMEVVSADYMQRKVYCSLCPKRFWSLQDLRRHMRSHTGERPFECDICHKRFTLKHSMMRHRKKHLDSGSLSPSDDEDNNNNHNEPGMSKLVTHHRPILPRMPTAIPVIPVTVMTESPKVVQENRPQFITVTSSSTPQQTKTTTITMESDSKDNSADILHNLLGVDVGSIDQMLDSADNAAKLLGV